MAHKPDGLSGEKVQDVLGKTHAREPWADLGTCSLRTSQTSVFLFSLCICPVFFISSHNLPKNISEYENPTFKRSLLSILLPP